MTEKNVLAELKCPPMLVKGADRFPSWDLPGGTNAVLQIFSLFNNDLEEKLGNDMGVEKLIKMPEPGSVLLSQQNHLNLYYSNKLRKYYILSVY